MSWSYPWGRAREKEEIVVRPIFPTAKKTQTLFITTTLSKWRSKTKTSSMMKTNRFNRFTKMNGMNNSQCLLEKELSKAPAMPILTFCIWRRTKTIKMH